MMSFSSSFRFLLENTNKDLNYYHFFFTSSSREPRVAIWFFPFEPHSGPDPDEGYKLRKCYRPKMNQWLSLMGRDLTLHATLSLKRLAGPSRRERSRYKVPWYVVWRFVGPELLTGTADTSICPLPGAKPCPQFYLSWKWDQFSMGRFSFPGGHPSHIFQCE